MKKSIPVIVQHIVGADKGGPKKQLDLLVQSGLANKYKFEIVSQDKAANGLNLSLIMDMARSMKKIAPDIVHIRGLNNGGFHGMLAAKIARCPRILVSVHGISGDSIRQGIKLKLQQFFLHNIFEPYTLWSADGVYCVCEYASKRLFIKRYARKLYGVVYNGIEINKSVVRDYKYRDELGYGKDDVVGIYVGRIVRDKGLFYLAETIKQLDDKGLLQPKIIIVGDGPDTDLIKKQYLRQIESGRIKMLGSCSAVSRVLSISDFFVFPTLHENFSNALLEASFAALPILATSVGGNPEIVKNGQTGILISAKSTKEIEYGLKWMVENPEKRRKMGLLGKLHVERNFSMKQTIEKLDNIYQHMLNKEK